MGYTWASNYFKRVFAVSAMPNFHFTKEQARSLTYYMLSLTNADMGTYYSSVRLIPSPEYGRELFVERICISLPTWSQRRGAVPLRDDGCVRHQPFQSRERSHQVWQNIAVKMKYSIPPGMKQETFLEEAAYALRSIPNLRH